MPPSGIAVTITLFCGLLGVVPSVILSVTLPLLTALVSFNKISLLVFPRVSEFVPSMYGAVVPQPKAQKAIANNTSDKEITLKIFFIILSSTVFSKFKIIALHHYITNTSITI